MDPEKLRERMYEMMSMIDIIEEEFIPLNDGNGYIYRGKAQYGEHIKTFNVHVDRKSRVKESGFVKDMMVSIAASLLNTVYGEAA